MGERRRLIVTGCNGQLGRALERQYRDSAEYEYIGTDVGELDITDADAVCAYAAEQKPYAIINCAAYTNVDGCESNEETAYRINAIGPRNLAVAAEECGAKLVHISTDYVFPGNGTIPYTEDMPCEPRSAYGRTKLAGEGYVREFSRRHFILRTAWLYGDGKNFVRTMLALSEKNDTIGVVNDQLGNPTSAAELARVIAGLLPTRQYGTYHATCEGICSWAEFTEEIFRIAGRPTKVERISSMEYKRRFPASADRPAYSALDNRMLRLSTKLVFKDWKEALAEYLREELA